MFEVGRCVRGREGGRRVVSLNRALCFCGCAFVYWQMIASSNVEEMKEILGEMERRIKEVAVLSSMLSLPNFFLTVVFSCMGVCIISCSPFFWMRLSFALHFLPRSSFFSMPSILLLPICNPITAPYAHHRNLSTPRIIPGCFLSCGVTGARGSASAPIERAPCR